MEKNVAGQKWVVFAFDETDNTAKAGDAGNITANLRIDGGAADAVDDANPTELEDGYYVFDLTQGETNGDYILICPASSTSDIQVIGVPGAVWTTSPSGVKKNVALNDLTFLMVSSTDHTTPTTGLTVTAQISKEGGAFADCTNAVVEVGSGFYKVDLTQTEMNATVIALKFTATGADQTPITIVTST